MGYLEILVILFVACPLAGAVAYRVRHGSSGGGEGPAKPLAPDELPAVRDELRELRERVEMLAEQQDFLERLLEKRPAVEAADEERRTAR